MNFPRMIIAALRGGSGKTILTIGIIAALRDLGKKPAPFKKGPDYIDAGWLALSAGRPCYNLDTFLLKAEDVQSSFLSHITAGDIAIIEGNRGLYDGLDADGSTSTAELAKLLDAPVILCIDCTKSTRTMAAAVLGCLHFDPDLAIRGVILNRVAGQRHETILRQSIEKHCGIPVLGAIPKLKKDSFPERHMGLTPTHEHARTAESIAAICDTAKRHLDLKALLDIAGEAAANALTPVCDRQTSVAPEPQSVPEGSRPRIGIMKDSAFQFYYPENIEALAAAGAETLYISPFNQESLPDVDALYIGGGFPETHLEQLAQNRTFRNALKRQAQKGLPIYAECGGLMYLGEELVMQGRSYPMTGVLPIVFGISRKPQGHGYTVVKVDRQNPYYPVGSEIRGHEFHYSYVLKWGGEDSDMVFGMKRGTGLIHNRDGVCYKNVLATYTHVHALGTPGWAVAMVRSAALYRDQKTRA